MTPGVRDLVLVGGGHAHIEVLRRLGRRPAPSARIALISRDRYTLYSGMLPGLIAGHYRFAEAHVDLEVVAAFAGARLMLDEVVALDPVQRCVRCAGGRTVSYDLLSIDIGSTPGLAVPGAAAHTVPVKPISNVLDRWNALSERVAGAAATVRVGVVGGGAGGVELMLAAQHRLGIARQATGGPDRRVECHLFCPAILPAYRERTRRIVEAILRRKGIVAHTGVRVERVSAAGLHTSDGEVHAMDEVLWVTAAAAAPWVGAAGLAVDGGGFVRVGDTLASVSHAGVFAAGDIASVDGHALPRSGVVAVRQGPVLAHNLHAALEGTAPRRYRPQRRYLSLISTGDRYAVGERGRLVIRGRWVWRLKDWIDRRFVRRYNGLVSEPRS